MVDTAKRMLTKEKIDKQLVGQTSSTPFMSMRDSQSKRVSFNTPDDLEQKIDRLTVMMGKLVTEDEGHPKSFKPQVYQFSMTKKSLIISSHSQVFTTFK